MNDRVLFIGGPGTLSTSAIRDLLHKGYQIGVFSTGGLRNELDQRVKAYFGRREDTPALAEAIAGFHPDVVLDFVLFDPIQAEQAISLAEGRIRQFVFVSTVDVYGYPLSRLPFREDDPWRDTTQSSYADNKRRCEKILRERFYAKGFPLTIARPAYSFGPRFILSFMSREHGVHMLRRLRTGRAVMVPGDGTTLIHVSSADNTGKMIAALVDHPHAVGNDYTCGHPTFMTHDGYVHLFASALGVEPRIVHIPSDLITSFDDEEVKECLLHALTRFNVAFSIERFLRDLPEFRWEVSLHDWAKHVVTWNETSGLLSEQHDEIIDDRILCAWQRCLESFYRRAN